MKKRNNKTTYDPDADVLSIEANGKQKIDYATETGNFVVHFNRENRPVLVEVLNASKFLKRASGLLNRTHRVSVVR